MKVNVKHSGGLCFLFLPYKLTVRLTHDLTTTTIAAAAAAAATTTTTTTTTTTSEHYY